MSDICRGCGEEYGDCTCRPEDLAPEKKSDWVITVDKVTLEPQTEDEGKIAIMMARYLNIFAQKNHDYGSSWRKRGLVGIINKLQTKVDRLATVSETGHEIKVNEDIGDTLDDLIIYGIMAKILYEEENR